MPNLKPPVVTVAQAGAYRDRILAALPDRLCFEPLMTLYLTEQTAPEEIDRAVASGFVHAVKYYPAGATTHSDAGVTDPVRVARVLERMQARDLPLLVHGEVTDPGVDVFDREAAFIDRELDWIVRNFPGLRIVFEHITTIQAVSFVREAPATVAATITAHHLLLDRNALFDGGLRPHHYCLPVLKRATHREALVGAATSGDARFFLGTDSAPHLRSAKESDCGCAGVYSAPVALEVCAQVFERAGALDRLEGFVSHFGADFYRLPRNQQRIRLVRRPHRVPESIEVPGGELVPLAAGKVLDWRLEA